MRRKRWSKGSNVSFYLSRPSLAIGGIDQCQPGSGYIMELGFVRRFSIFKFPYGSLFLSGKV